MINNANGMEPFPYNSNFGKHDNYNSVDNTQKTPELFETTKQTTTKSAIEELLNGTLPYIDEYFDGME